MSWRRGGVLALVLLCAGLLGGMLARGLGGFEIGVHEDAESVQPGPAASVSVARLRERGAYLARAGNCAACHTAPGGAPYAGGRAIDTPFGQVFSSNLTPDPETGLGRWTADDFWRALHHGRSRDGRLLSPAFPYTEFTRVTRADADALWAHLGSLPATRQPPRESTLAWPYGTQLATAVWRALYFRPGVWRDEAGRSPEWNRGAYLVNGLGHCAACHAPRDRWGGYRPGAALSGHLMGSQSWYAPALSDVREAGVAADQVEALVQLLRSGANAHATVGGPMAEVVYASTQYLTASDLRAMGVYLSTLAPQAAAELPRRAPVPGQMALGESLYGRHCAACHGEAGQGVVGAYPALAGNRALSLGEPANLVRWVLDGGYGPSTAERPRPHGMPPFRQQLSDADVAALLTYVRSVWGQGAGAVSALDVQRGHLGAAP